jgi:type IV pilus assembly protein PilE
MIKTFLKNNAGFTLTEILVVLVIIGILILLAMPRFSKVITRAKSTEARTMLKHIHVLQQSYFYEHDRFSKDLNSIGFEQTELITEGGEARYKIEIISASPAGYQARAVAVVDFDNDGIFNTWEVNENGRVKQIIPD